MNAEPYDIIQIGYGPVSKGLALMLGQQNRRVAICERWETRYPLPRAVCIDHELYRVLSANGIGDILPHVSHRGPLYQWFNADWKELLVIDWSADSISGGPEVNFVHQPTLEEALDQAVAAQSSVDTFLGWEAVAIRQDTDLVHVTLRRSESDEEKVLSARYLVGCDGANSLVRNTIGGAQEDRGFEADWLVIDALLKDGVTIEQLGIPPAGQYCNPARPTTIVPAGIRDGRFYRRWEFMRLPGERPEDLEQEERVWDLLSPWAGPQDIELVRHKVYNFRSLLASRWRDGRFVIAGDAAHVMPPFMGQGMCSGLRDAWNLAWRFNLILDGKAADHLLDSYQAERHPHVSQLIDLSIYLGKVICIPDAGKAAERDLAFLGGTASPPPAFPHLTAGLLRRREDGELSPGAGMLSPHVDIEASGFRGRLDDYAGPGFVLFTRSPDAIAALPANDTETLSFIGARVFAVNVPNDEKSVTDRDGRLVGLMDAQGWDSMIVRPDFYIYGGASAGALPSLIADFLADMRRAGLRDPDLTGKFIKEEVAL